VVFSMATDRDEAVWESARGLDERVLSTLQSLPGRIAFSGLRRVLRAHPESLSRSLRRLEREGQVERSRDGYRAVRPRREEASGVLDGLRAIAHIELPPGALPDMVFGRISGRWFGSLRWVGVVDGPQGRLLTWARRDGSGPVLLGIDRGVLRVYVREDEPSDDEDAEDAAYELLTHAVGALRPSPATLSGPVSLLAATSDAPDRWTDN
jgi:hypothetical protein